MRRLDIEFVDKQGFKTHFTQFEVERDGSASITDLFDSLERLNDGWTIKKIKLSEHPSVKEREALLEALREMLLSAYYNGRYVATPLCGFAEDEDGTLYELIRS